MHLKTDLAIVLMGFFAFLSSCSRDTEILGDYKLYDLDGSNQAIIGDHGMVSVSDVTSYSIDDTNIIFETGILDSDVTEKTGNNDQCRYGFVDTKNQKIIFSKNDDQLSRNIRNKLMKLKMSTVSRSCLKSH